MCTSVTDDDRRKWLAEIVDAENQRLQTPAAMDIMGRRNVAAAASNDRDSSEKEKNSAGEDWITFALSVEERQCVALFFSLGLLPLI